jgi:hypothetical protein
MQDARKLSKIRRSAAQGQLYLPKHQSNCVPGKSSGCGGGRDAGCCGPSSRRHNTHAASNPNAEVVNPTTAAWWEGQQTYKGAGFGAMPWCEKIPQRGLLLLRDQNHRECRSAASTASP